MLLSLIYIVSSILIAVLLPHTIKKYDSYYFYGYLSPFVIIGSLCIYKLFVQLKLGENIFSRISHLTLGIYLIHAGVLVVINKGLSLLNINSLNNPIIGIPVKFLVTFFISILLTWVISKIKYIRKVI